MTPEQARTGALRLQVEELSALVADVGGEQEPEAEQREEHRAECRAAEDEERPTRERIAARSASSARREDTASTSNGGRRKPAATSSTASELGAPIQISFVRAAPGLVAFIAVNASARSATTKSPWRVGNRRATATTRVRSTPPVMRRGRTPSAPTAAASPGLAMTGTASSSVGWGGWNRAPRPR